jgi:hypothetical protein
MLPNDVEGHAEKYLRDRLDSKAKVPRVHDSLRVSMVPADCSRDDSRHKAFEGDAS